MSGVKWKVSIFLCMLIIVLSTVFGCGSNSINDSSTTPYFPVQKAGLAQMDSLLEGILELDNNDCLRVDGSLIIWPYDFSLRIEGQEIQVIDSNGQIFARVGDKITLGGGEIPGTRAKELIEDFIVGKPLPDACPGPYWVVGSVIK